MTLANLLSVVLLGTAAGAATQHPLRKAASTHSHSPHSHSPHSHSPHSHSPHSHSPAPPAAPPVPPAPPPSPSTPPSSPPALRRFEFVDGVSGTGAWTTGNGAYSDVSCAADGYVYFQWHSAYHDLVLLPSQAAFDSCDFSAAETLVPVGAPAAANGLTSYYLPCTNPGSTLHLACSVSSHCASGGQKVRVHVSSTEHVFNTSDPAREVLIHSDSLARVHTLLGHRFDATTGFSHLDLGYHSEASANATLELIWCLEAHCPESARDVDPAATYGSCMADVYNLGGFVSRKRPQPQFDHAEAYYRTALGFSPSHCPTLGYLAELYLMTNNASAANETALALCAACGGATSSASLQAKAAFDASGVAAFPCVPAPSPVPSASEAASVSPALLGGLGAAAGVVALLGAAYVYVSFCKGGRVVDSPRGKSHAKRQQANDPLDVASTPSVTTAVA